MMRNDSNPSVSRSESQHCILSDPCSFCTVLSAVKLVTLHTAEQSLWPTTRSPVIVAQEEKGWSSSTLVTTLDNVEQAAERGECTVVIFFSFYAA